MSVCISREGEYSDHEPDGNYGCRRCFVFDEDAALGEINRLHAEAVARSATPDAHMVETLRLRTAALHRVSRSNDLLRRENDDLRARLIDAEDLIQQLRQAQ